MKKAIIILLVLIPLLSFGQTYIGQNIAQVLTDNSDFRYNVSDVQMIGMVNDSICAQYFSSYSKDLVNAGTFVYYNQHGIIINQDMLFYDKHSDLAIEHQIYLSSIGYVVSFKRLNNTFCSLKISK